MNEAKQFLLDDLEAAYQKVKRWKQMGKMEFSGDRKRIYVSAGDNFRIEIDYDDVDQKYASLNDKFLFRLWNSWPAIREVLGYPK